MGPKIETLPINISPRKQPPRSIEKDDPKQPTWDRGQLPSHIAALVAASKPPTYHASQAARRPFLLQDFPSEALPMVQRTDETPIPSTNTLVKLFESQAAIPNLSSQSSIPRQGIFPLQSANPSNIALAAGEELSQFPISKTTEKSHDRAKAARPSVRKLGPVSRSTATATTAITDSSIARPESSNQTTSHKGPPPTPPQLRRTRQDRVVKTRSNGRSVFASDSDEHSSASSYVSALDVIQSPQAFGGPSPTAELGTSRATKPSGQSVRSLANNLLSSRQQKCPDITRDSGRDENVMARKWSLKEGPLLPNSLTPQLTADSLANAMVASSLASSRASSPSKPAPPLPRRHPKPHPFFNRSQSQEQVQSRTPSPGRGMRLTMRESPKPDEDDERKKRGGYLLKKHPNKHHEGDRKRWRDQITEQERKRYEGVWAANKGLFMPSNDMTCAATVLNLVVRDIWRRSRLPDDVLEEIWDLVDAERVGRLGKAEFVVGLWLIDQRLKGRKLPMKVSDSVWFSARRLSGIKVAKSPR
ncbi:Increased rDNA silencing protein [Pseudocyphellaria aurata]|nr:Increased rDNA silencing protein [Pseudocyphellaria aurata]